MGICEMFGLRYPILGAPMFLVSNAQMAVAIGEAGGLGAIPAQNYRTLGELRTAIREIKDRTSAAFGINLILLQNDRVREELALLIEERVPLIITSLGNPREIIQLAHAHGIRVFCDVVNLHHARKSEEAGADAVIAVGSGAGGHAGVISPLVLIPYLRKHLSIPVVAAGGIATGAGVAAALALGASAAYLGTRFIASDEAHVPAGYREMILRSGPEDVEYTAEVTGHPANFMRDSLQSFRELGTQARRWKDAWSAGQTVGLIDEVLDCRSIVARLVAEYEEARRGLPVLA